MSTAQPRTVLNALRGAPPTLNNQTDRARLRGVCFKDSEGVCGESSPHSQQSVSPSVSQSLSVSV